MGAVSAKTILVCGGAGYIGSHMVRLLAESGYSPLILDDLSTGHAEAVPCDRARRRAGDPPFLVADSARARAELGWQPKYAQIESILETAWNWHRSPRF